ncbi:uncharacterized protein METZ01_LOCUS264678, partial [marine metagenome]
VFASDIDISAAEVYETNWGKPGGFEVLSDIRDIIDDVPSMDIICAGFPCQPFSKSGGQAGFEDQTRGTLFHDICYLAEKHSPAVMFLENVPNLVNHDGGNTFGVIESRVRELGYGFWWKILSPHKLGTPQIRTRVYMVCIRDDLIADREFTFPEESVDHELDVKSVLDGEVDEEYGISDEETLWIEMWDDFLKNVNTQTKLPGHPIWADFFLGCEPLPGNLQSLPLEGLRDRASEWGVDFDEDDEEEELVRKINLPDWKQDFIRKNRKLYRENSEFIDRWLVKWKVLEDDEEGNPVIILSRRKFEWQAGPDSRSNWENLMQFRPSGLRVKRPNYFPALVAITQTPIVGWLRRNITPKECARLQDF